MGAVREKGGEPEEEPINDSADAEIDETVPSEHQYLLRAWQRHTTALRGALLEHRRQ